MSETKRNILVGVTTIVALVGMGYMVLIFGEVPGWMANEYVVKVNLDSAGGLASGSRVHLNGVDVGQVKTVRLTEHLDVELTCLIDGTFRIPATAKVHVAASVLGGTARLDITAPPLPPDAPPATYLPTDGSSALTGSSSQLTERLVGQVDAFVADARKAMAKFDEVATSFTETAKQFTATAKKVEQQFDPQSDDDIASGRVKANLNSAIAEAHARLVEAQTAIDSINKLVSDEQLLRDIRQTAANARKATENADKLVTDAGVKVDQVARRIVALADDASKTLEHANQLMAEMRSGQGTAGRFVQDPAMYNAVTDAALRLGDALKELKLLIEKWKAEGLDLNF